MIRKNGFSLAEVMIAIFVCAVVLIPLTNLLFSGNKTASGSIYPILATFYATELCEQLLSLNVSPGFKRICGSDDLGILLPTINSSLKDTSKTFPYAVNLSSGGGASIQFFVSPLTEGFCERRLEAEAVGIPQRGQGEYYKVTVILEWNMMGEKPPATGGQHSHRSVVFLRKEG